MVGLLDVGIYYLVGPILPLLVLRHMIINKINLFLVVWCWNYSMSWFMRHWRSLCYHVNSHISKLLCARCMNNFAKETLNLHTWIIVLHKRNPTNTSNFPIARIQSDHRGMKSLNSFPIWERNPYSLVSLLQYYLILSLKLLIKGF